VSIFHLRGIKRTTTSYCSYYCNLKERTKTRKAYHNNCNDKVEAMPRLSGTCAGKYETKGACCWYTVGDHNAREKAGALLRDMVHSSTQHLSLPVKVRRQVKTAKTAKKTKAESVPRSRIQKPNKTRHHHQDGQLLVEYDTVSTHSDHCSSTAHQHTPTQQCCGEHAEPLVESGGNAGVKMVWPSDNSSASTLSYSGEQDSLVGLDHEDSWLIDEDYVLDLFGLLQYY
jgi:hypothetical protein